LFHNLLSHRVTAHIPGYLWAAHGDKLDMNLSGKKDKGREFKCDWLLKFWDQLK
jgi:hypothetical protein